jgi:hypothetical protein
MHNITLKSREWTRVMIDAEVRFVMGLTLAVSNIEEQSSKALKKSRVDKNHKIVERAM